MITISPSAGRRVAPRPLAEVDFSVSITPQNRIVRVGSFSDAVVKDRNMRTAVLSDFVTDAVIQVAGLAPGALQGYQIINLTPAIGTVGSGGAVTYLQNGLFSALIKTRWLTRRVDLPLFRTNNGSTTTFLNFVAGSAAANATAAVDTRIAAKHDPAANLPIFSTQDHANAIYVRNPASWPADLDLTSISPWNSQGGNLFAGELLSPRHVLFCAHLQPDIGCIMRFPRADGTVVEKPLANKITHPDYAPFYPDLCVGVLDSDVPSGIGFAKVLPANFATKLPNLTGIPALVLDQQEKALVDEVGGLTSTGGSIAFRYPTTPNRQVLYESIIPGDSGNPAFLIINNQLVLLTTWTYGGAGQGTFVSNFIPWINSAMTSLGGGYQLTPVDLSGFPSF